MNNQKPAKDPQIVTLSKRRVDGGVAFLEFFVEMGPLKLEVSALVPNGMAKRSTAIVWIHAGQPGALGGRRIGVSTQIRVSREDEYVVIPIRLGILEIHAVAKVSDEGEPDAPVYVNFKLPPAGTSIVQTPDGLYPEAANG